MKTKGAKSLLTISLSQLVSKLPHDAKIVIGRTWYINNFGALAAQEAELDPETETEIQINRDNNRQNNNVEEKPCFFTQVH